MGTERAGRPSAADSGACPLCGATDHRVVFVEGDVALHRCTNCGHAHSRLDQDEHYDGYWDQTITPADIEFWDGAHRLVHQAFIDRTLTASTGRLVDVGCGLGHFLALVRAKRPDWTLDGYELAAPAVEWAAEHLGLDGIVHKGLVQESGIEPGTVDVITMWDVLEHLPQPAPLLGYLRSLLRPGGVLFVQTPNQRVQVAKALATAAKDGGIVAGKNYLNLRDHVNLFTPASLSRLAADTGFGPPRHDVLPPITSIGGRRSRVAEVAKRTYGGVSRGLMVVSRHRVLTNPTIFAFLTPDPAWTAPPNGTAPPN